MSQNSNFTNIKSIHIEYTLFMSISLSILSLKLSMTMGTLYLIHFYIIISCSSDTYCHSKLFSSFFRQFLYSPVVILLSSVFSASAGIAQSRPNFTAPGILSREYIT